ncbi:zinc finger protein 644-like isoform X1 [Myxocyprinus asiaticus]|uniref:zinc finger protein 644-like isoform X1 n=2 Tax=Myxocyprinus asiaticus TaxID=70543 RepID=UPI00222216A9|nr:zinc finger protein 644-like isoform X1 [Myxocyprinus asiaticus]
MEDEKRTISKCHDKLVPCYNFILRWVYREPQCANVLENTDCVVPIMATVKESTEDDKEVESSSDDTQELTAISSHNNNNNNNNSLDPPELLPLDSHQNLLNGIQPNLFVCGSVPAAPSTNDSLPSGALVNGAASHCTSEGSCVHNKDMSPLPRTDTSPEVLLPPSELQSDTRQKAEGCTQKLLATRASSESSSSDGEAPLDVLVGEGLDNRPISRLLARKGIKAECLWDFNSELSESSSDDCDGLNWGLQENFMRLLLKSSVAGGVSTKVEIEGAPPANQRRRMRKTQTVERAATGGQVYNGFDYTSQNSLTDEDSDFDSSINKEHAFRNETESLKAYAGLHLEKFCDKAVAMKELISSKNEERCDKGSSDTETNTYMGEKLAPLKTETKTGRELSFSCSKCKINFKEKMHLQRHMMYHLDRNNKVRQEHVPRPFICRECGRSFRDLTSLQKHTIIHQVRREKLMEEIKGFSQIDVEGRRACLQCPQCVFGTKCPKTFVHYSETNEKEKHTYSWKKFDHMTMNEIELNASECTAHHDTYNKDGDSFVCQICTFRSKNNNAFRKHVELIHGQPYYEFYRVADQPKIKNSLMPKIQSTEKWSAKERGEVPFRPNNSADLNQRSIETEKACDVLSSSLIKWNPGSPANKLSPFSQRSDKQSKLSPLPTEKIDVTTGLPYVEEDNQEYESAVSEKRTKYLSSFDVHFTTKTEIVSKTACLNPGTESCPKDPSTSSTLALQTLRHKLPSKRKMSIPYHNTPVDVPHVRFPKCEPDSQQWETTKPQEGDDYEGAQDFNGYAKESADWSRSHTPCDYFNCGWTSPVKNNIPDYANHTNLENNIKVDSDEICTFIVKEECIESTINEDTPDPVVYNESDPYADYVVSPLSLVGRKCCPYCPAVFESGVGLSNHIRGHLHRVGLSYDARHVVSPEQVASQDCRHRIRRKIPSVNRRIRKDKPESKTEHTCPLCLGWFDTKTGLSNHVRGHLKRIGKPISGASKSPLWILTELLQDESEYRNIMRVLGARPHFSKPFFSQKFANSDGLFLTSTGIPIKIRHATGTPDAGQWSMIRSPPVDREMQRTDTVPSSILEDLLGNRKLEQEKEVRGHSEKNMTPLAISSTSGSIPRTSSVKLDPTWSEEKFAANKKICIHCNTTFQSAVSLSNHLRAYARRKRIALLEGTTYDCKQKRPRSRPGPKSKVFSSAHTASEVIYRMTCRFCGLTFQGPQSIQEDWIKHLQRHLMHTSISGMGAGMVEVSALCKELSSPSSPEHLLLDTHSTLSLPVGVS